MSALDDVGRMLALVPWLLARPGASLQEAAEAFGVSEQRIRTDLVDHLDFCGLPGLGGGALFDVAVVGERVVITMADELARPMRPTPAEALRLVLTVDAVAEVLGDELPALTSAAAKVRDALGVPERVADVLEPSTTSVVLEVRRALTEGRRLHLRYQGRGDDAPRDRTVDPWRVQVVSGDWYLQGHDQGADDLRTFRLDRVAEVTVSDDPVRVPAPADLPEPRYQPGEDDLAVTLAVTRAGRWLAEVLDVDRTEETSDGGALLHLTTDAPRHVARLVLVAGGAATVQTPEGLARAVRDLARSSAGRYED
ncbi:helix-turn-helix transcriptional regulator [Nitriliruptor alkaliphilus]|uniref:helix-turn-helix transcriptional regulator n=1 Tax=Nitriliruptor alkaliphilus TaxID=427918 RepID=UPI00069799F3|nr:WYL domain-containing protein [Nitriliruptor alkaliphilus]